MKTYTTLLFFFCSLFCLNAQDVNFDQPAILFEHPQNAGNGTGFSYPFLPYDYNNDGITDFAGSGFAEQSVYKGLVDGVYEPIQLTWSQAPIKVLDWNNDGIDDVIFERHILITGENDEFPLLNPSIPFGETIVDVADLNNDQLLDLITIERVTFGANPIHFYFNIGNDEFEKSTFITEGENEVVVAGDVSGDGTPDLFLATATRTDLYINQGDGTFVEEDIFLPNSGKGLLLTDLDNDNDLDIVFLAGIITAYLNENGVIDDSQEIKIFSPAEMVASGDLNNDGFNDFVSLYFADTAIVVQVGMNDGQGGFPFQSSELFRFPRTSTIGIPRREIMRNNLLIYDVNQDGKNDIVYVDGFSEVTSVNWVQNMTITNTMEFKDDVSVTIYPNPSSDVINIDTSIDFDSYTIVSANGSIIMSGISSHNIDISKFPIGIYSIVLMKNGISVANKIFIKGS